MKIGFVYDAVYPWVKGGAERLFYEVGRRLVKRGHEVHWWGMKSWTGTDTIENEGMLCHSLGPAVPMYHRSGRRSITEALAFGLYGLRMLGAQKLDVVDCGQFPYFHLLPLRARCWLGGTPMVVSWYEVWGDHWYEYLGRPGFIGKAVERTFTRIPDHIVAVSEQTRRDILGLGAPESKVELIPLGIDFRAIKQVAPSDHPHDIVYIGRLKKHKNVDALITAVALLKRSIPAVSAGIIGDGPEMENLRSRARALGVENNVTFYGAIERFEDAAAIMKAAAVFMHPSTKEGGGSITLFEANACGLPVIAVRCPNGIDPSLIEERRNGAWVESLSPETLAAAAESLLKDRAALDALKRDSIGFAKQFDWDIITARYEDTYRRVAGAGRAKG
jgi:glycosyltransferase involved in cell wall biosynthesis